MKSLLYVLHTAGGKGGFFKVEVHIRALSKDEISDF